MKYYTMISYVRAQEVGLMTYKQIGVKWGVNERAVRYRLAKHGVTPLKIAGSNSQKGLSFEEVDRITRMYGY